MTIEHLPDHQVVAIARSWVGTPYLHQASAKNIGCDCLGLVVGVWREITGTVPTIPMNYSSSWNAIDDKETLLAGLHTHLHAIDNQQPDAGTVGVMRMRRNRAAKHLVILTGEGTFIHAYDGNHVVENTLSDFWQNRIVARFKYPSVERIA